jgi:DNA repair protein RadC
VKRALELGASALIMVHNHPSGDPTPSKADIDMTRDVRDALSKVDIRLHDHIIVAKSEFRSLKTDGYI